MMTKRLRHQILKQSYEFDAQIDNRTLRIICADESHLNLEALKIVFKKIGLSDYCEFVSDG